MKVEIIEFNKLIENDKTYYRYLYINYNDKVFKKDAHTSMPYRTETEARIAFNESNCNDNGSLKLIAILKFTQE